MTNISRSRGYSFENQLVHRLHSAGYKAKRLGGTSIEFPDIVATKTKQSVLLAVEAKAYSSDNIYIPIDQFHRCFDVCSMFDLYEHRSAIFAFKFNRIVGKRSVKYYFGFMDANEYDGKDIKVSCNYDNGIRPKKIQEIWLF